MFIVVDVTTEVTRMSYPAVHLNCIKYPLYHDACIIIFDRVLIWVYSWVAFEECPLRAGSLLAPLLLVRERSALADPYCQSAWNSVGVFVAVFVRNFEVKYLENQRC